MLIWEDHWQVQRFLGNHCKFVLNQPLQIFNGFWRDHHHWMFFGGLTIATNGFSMVFDFATIAFNGFRWFRTIGQTMRWFRWIVVVYFGRCRPWWQPWQLCHSWLQPCLKSWGAWCGVALQVWNRMVAHCSRLWQNNAPHSRNLLSFTLVTLGPRGCFHRKHAQRQKPSYKILYEALS